MIDGPLAAPKGQLMILRSTDWKREGKGEKVYYQRKESFTIKVYQSVRSELPCHRDDKRNCWKNFSLDNTAELKKKISSLIYSRIVGKRNNCAHSIKLNSLFFFQSVDSILHFVAGDNDTGRGRGQF